MRIQNLNDPDAEFNFCDARVEDKYYIDSGQLLFAWSGTPGTSFGAHIWIKGRAVLNQHIFRVEVSDGCVDKKFLMLALNHNVTEYIGKAHGGAGLAHITKGRFTESALAVPPHPEQRRIVAKIEELFSQLDAGVEELTKAKAQLKRYRQSVFKAAFEGKLTEEWRRKNLTTKTPRHKEGKKPETAQELLARIREERTKALGRKYKEPPPLDTSELPELPESWAWAPLNLVCDTVTDGDHQPPPKSVEGVPFVVISDVRAGVVDFEHARRVPHSYYENLDEYRRAVKGDVLFTVVGSYGIPVLVDTSEPFCFQRHIALLKPNVAIAGSYLRYSLATRATFDQATRVATGTAQKTVPLSGLRRIAVPVLPTEEQRVLMAEVERLLSIADAEEKAIEAALKQAARLRQSILKRAFEGRLVPQDPTDEPATELLRRIREERLARSDGRLVRRGKRVATK